MIACEYYVMIMMLHNIMRTDRETSITLGMRRAFIHCSHRTWYET
jgi:hypothetical protein